MKLKFLLPLIIFIIISIFLLIGLNLDPKKIPSPLVGKSAPTFTLPILTAEINENNTFSPKEMDGKVWLMNVWASWCVSCREEHPLLMQISQNNAVPIIGLNWKDEKEDAIKVLTKTGDPYLLSAFDYENRVGINYGVYGTPETFVIDKKGIIRHKQIGPLTSQVWQNDFLPLIAKLNAEN